MLASAAAPLPGAAETAFTSIHTPSIAFTSALADTSRMVVEMVVEIPAGTTDKIEYDPAKGDFALDRVIDYLPYPANYGFLAGTLGGDGDPLDAILLSRALPTGTRVRGLAVATLRLTDRGEPDEKVLLVPLDPAARLNACATWDCLRAYHPDLILILETWFRHYKGPGVMRFDGWAGPEATQVLIEGYTLPSAVDATPSR